MLRALAWVSVAALAAAPAPTADRNVSRADGDQAEVAVAADPDNPDVLVAASNDFGGNGIVQRVYGSTDGGSSWSSERRAAPPGADPFCVDPAVAVLHGGRQLHVFACELPRGAGAVYAARRTGPRAAWEPARPVARPPFGSSDDKPALTVDAWAGSRYAGRAYVLWSRLGGGRWAIMAGRSTDGGRTWKRPVVVSDRGGNLSYASAAARPDGSLVAVWSELAGPRPAIFAARSTDGGASFGPASLVAHTAPGDPRCGESPGWSIPAQLRRCVRANPIVTADPGGRAFVTWSDVGARGRLDVHVAELGPRLGRSFHRLIAPPSAADRFWRVSAADRASGELWACWYDTGGDRSRRSTRFVCSASRSRGRAWTPARPVSSRRSSMRVPAAGEFEYGDYEGLAVAGGVAHPMWTDARDLRARGAEIRTAALDYSAACRCSAGARSQ